MTAALPVFRNRVVTRAPWDYLYTLVGKDGRKLRSVLDSWAKSIQENPYLTQLAEDTSFLVKNIAKDESQEGRFLETLSSLGVTDPRVSGYLSSILGYKSLNLKEWEPFLKTDVFWHLAYAEPREKKRFFHEAYLNSVGPAVAGIVSFIGLPFIEFLTVGAGMLHTSMHLLPEVQRRQAEKGEFPLISVMETDEGAFIDRFPAITKQVDARSLTSAFPKMENRFSVVGLESVFPCMLPQDVAMAIREIALMKPQIVFHVSDTGPDLDFYPGNLQLRDKITAGTASPEERKISIDSRHVEVLRLMKREAKKNGMSFAHLPIWGKMIISTTAPLPEPLSKMALHKNRIFGNLGMGICTYDPTIPAGLREIYNYAELSIMTPGDPQDVIDRINQFYSPPSGIDKSMELKV